MQQLDLFDETLSKKICRMEKWIARLQKEVWFLKQVHDLAAQSKPSKKIQVLEQSDMFGT